MSTPFKERIAQKWSNKDNVSFYKHMPLDDFRSFASQVGIANGEDVDQVKDLVSNANSILEFGGGYGRVVDSVLRINPRAHVTTVERNERLANYLDNKYSSNVDVIMADLLDAQITEEFDLILMMWSSLGEFCKEEQQLVFDLYSTILKNGGCLVVDMIELTSRPPVYAYLDLIESPPSLLPSNKREGENYHVDINKREVNVYMPTAYELTNYAQKSNLCFLEVVRCELVTRSFRNLFIFKKV